MNHIARAWQCHTENSQNSLTDALCQAYTTRAIAFGCDLTPFGSRPRPRAGRSTDNEPKKRCPTGYSTPGTGR